jgi:hypothetical protein
VVAGVASGAWAESRLGSKLLDPRLSLLVSDETSLYIVGDAVFAPAIFAPVIPLHPVPLVLAPGICFSARVPWDPRPPPLQY